MPVLRIWGNVCPLIPKKHYTKMLIETELIALYCKLGDVVWIRYFIECQDYDIDECVIYQDNICALSMDKNRHTLLLKCKKHMQCIS